MGGRDVLKVLKSNDGIELIELFDRVSHLVNRSSFNNNIRSLLKSNDIMKTERIKNNGGVRKVVIRVWKL